MVVPLFGNITEYSLPENTINPPFWPPLYSLAGMLASHRFRQNVH